MGVFRDEKRIAELLEQMGGIETPVSGDLEERMISGLEKIAENADFVINYTGEDADVISCNKTAAEIYAAYENGKALTAMYDENILYLCNAYKSDGSDEFVHLSFTNVDSFGPDENNTFSVINIMHESVNNEEEIYITTGDLITEQYLKQYLKFFANTTIGYDWENEGVTIHSNYDLNTLLARYNDPTTISARISGNETEKTILPLSQHTCSPYNGGARHVFYFTSVIPTVSGLKFQTITQEIIVDESGNVTDHSEIYEEKDITIES